MRSDVASGEAELIERIRAGDPEAFEVVFRCHYPALLRFARAHLGVGADAEDAVHEVFLRVWRDRARLEVDRSLRGYLLAAVRNRVIDVARHRAASRRVCEERSVAAGGEGGVVGSVPIGASDPAELAELDDAIRASIAALPERCRTAFLLCREEEMTYAEVAAVMGVTPATVKTQMARALAALRAALGPFLLLFLSLMTPFR